MGFLALEENEEEGWDGTVTLDARVEDKHKSGVLGEAASSPPLPRYQLGSVSSRKGEL